MDNHKHENCDKDIGDPWAPTVSPRTAGGITQRGNAESQVGERMKPSAKTVREVATKPKTEATTISLGGTSSDSFYSAPGMSACSSLGAETGIATNGPPRRSDVGTYKHLGLNRKPKVDKNATDSAISSSTNAAERPLFVGVTAIKGNRGFGEKTKSHTKEKPQAIPLVVNSAGRGLRKNQQSAQKQIPPQQGLASAKDGSPDIFPGEDDIVVDMNDDESPALTNRICSPAPLPGRGSTVHKYFEDDLHIEKSRRANPSGNHATFDTVGKYFEDDLFIEKSRRANPSRNHAVEAGRGCEGNAAVWANFEDDLLTKKRQMEKPSYVSYLDEDPPSSEKPSYISHSEEAPPSNSLLAADLEPIPIPAPPNIGIVPQHRPGAYTEAPGANLQRLDQPRFSLIGVEQANDDEGVGNENSDEEVADVTEAEVPTNTILPRPSNTDLAVATAIGNSTSVLLMEARVIDPEVLQKLENKERKRKKFRIIGCVIIVVCSIVLGISMGLSFGRTEVAPSTRQPTMAPTQSPTRSLPPMENLELLYNELPEKTKERLYESNSPQYQAWEWLLNHPDITTYPEWRKKQVFAMVTFFFCFKGTNWPEQIQNKWLNVTASECHWASSEAEVLHFTRLSAEHFGPGAYRPQDIHPCNKNGEVQTLLIHQLYLSDKVTPHMPPEIGLLTSLRILAIQSGQIGGSELSDFLVPELILLPNLEFISFYSTGIRGTIPKEVGGMTGLRHLIIGENQLTGTFPSEIAKISSLEYLTLWRNDIAGSIPSELGLMTSLTALEIDSNHLTGTIPTELGLLSSIQYFWSGNNALSGRIPTQLGLITNCINLGLGNGMEVSPEGPYNNFSASLPTELWQLLNLEGLVLNNLPNLHGSIPTEMMLNLTLFRLEGSPNLVGTIPEVICYLQEQKIDNLGEAMDFDCSSTFCGCDCRCVNNKTNNI